MLLYYAPGACSLASHIALIEGGVEYKKVKVDIHEHETEDGRDFYEINPRGYVPTIESDEYGLITENAAVLPFIADRTGALPTGEPLYRVMEWIGFIGTEIHTAFQPFFADDADEEYLENNREVIEDRLELVADRLADRQWLVGDTPTVADNYMFVMAMWCDKFGIDMPEPLDAFRDRNLERPAVKQAMQEEGLD